MYEKLTKQDVKQSARSAEYNVELEGRELVNHREGSPEVAFPGKLIRRQVKLRGSHADKPKVDQGRSYITRAPTLADKPNRYFCREALMRRSLNHERVLPSLGIFEDEPASLSPGHSTSEIRSIVTSTRN
ncbi:hypothetical protein F5887DRAFT_912788 [Amanita rubescens]|nr:hypothetical protein F5887DRAFT_912788 [Amanita rubescens]